MAYAVPVTGAAVLTQTPTPSSGPDNDEPLSQDNQDDTGKYGLAGLTGLLGLFGYKKYKDHRATTARATGTTGGKIGGVDNDGSGSRRV